MSDGASAAAVAAAAAYESLHVPALFGAWAGPVLDAAKVAGGQRVADVACGTGILARSARVRVGEDGSVVGVDPDAGMLAVAAREAPDVEWRIGTAEALPLDDGSQDAVVSQFGMMFFRDRDRAATEMLRVLVDGGHVAVAVWDTLERSPAYSTLVALLDDLAGSDAADALRAPFALGDAHEFALPFRRAGVDGLKLVTRSGTARFPDVRTMVEADLRGWLPVMGVVLEDERIEEILAEAERALRKFVDAEGRMAFPSSAHILSGFKA